MSFTRNIFSPQDITIFSVYRTEMISACDQLKRLDRPVI